MLYQHTTRIAKESRTGGKATRIRPRAVAKRFVYQRYNRKNRRSAMLPSIAPAWLAARAGGISSQQPHEYSRPTRQTQRRYKQLLETKMYGKQGHSSDLAAAWRAPRAYDSL